MNIPKWTNTKIGFGYGSYGFGDAIGNGLSDGNGNGTGDGGGDLIAGDGYSYGIGTSYGYGIGNYGEASCHGSGYGLVHRPVAWGDGSGKGVNRKHDIV